MTVESRRVDLLKVFISSPDDATAFRDLAEDIINQDINSVTADLLGLILQPDRWENWPPGVAAGELESVWLERVKESRVFVCILRHQYGQGGTEQELTLALERHRRGEIEKLYVFCERTEDAEPELNNLKERLRQDHRVFWKTFAGREDFARAFAQAMWAYIIESKVRPTTTSSTAETL